MRANLVALTCCLLLAACTAAPPTDPSPQQRTTASFDGVDISYEVRGDGSPALVLIHGWACNRHHWKNQVDLFDDDHRIVALDLAGHGQSGHERDEWSLPALARDVQAVVEAESLERIILIGHSMGGPVALIAAANMPDRTVAVIGVDTLHDAEMKFTKEMAEPLLRAMSADYDAFLDRFVRGAFQGNPDADEQTIAWVIEGARNTDLAAASGLMRSYLDLDVTHFFKACPVPLRCINAAGSLPTKVETNRKYHPDFDVVVIEDSGHFPMLEQPDAFNRALADLLAEFP